MCSDYRITKYDDEFGNIEEKKKEYEKELRKAHPIAKDLHKCISPNEVEKKRFMNVYNCRCSYCGIPLEYNHITQFEIDHIIPSSSFATKTEAGYLGNLALACHNCNHDKSDLQLDLSVMHPDTGIGKVYYRDDLYYIKISPKYESNPYVVEFYKKLNFGGSLKRLDYILMNLSGMQRVFREKKGDNNPRIDQAIIFLRTKRNSCGPKD